MPIEQPDPRGRMADGSEKGETGDEGRTGESPRGVSKKPRFLPLAPPYVQNLATIIDRRGPGQASPEKVDVGHRKVRRKGNLLKKLEYPLNTTVAKPVPDRELLMAIL